MRIELTDDQALVLSDWMYRTLHRPEFTAVVKGEDRAVWSALMTINGALETGIPEVFAADYAQRLTAARARLEEELGDAWKD